MKIKLRTVQHAIAQLTIEAESTRISEDLGLIFKEGKGYQVEDEVIDQFITIANELSRFNRVYDVDFVKKIYDDFLSDDEKEEFLNLLNETV